LMDIIKPHWPYYKESEFDYGKAQVKSAFNKS